MPAPAEIFRALITRLGAVRYTCARVTTSASSNSPVLRLAITVIDLVVRDRDKQIPLLGNELVAIETRWDWHSNLCGGFIKSRTSTPLQFQLEANLIPLLGELISGTS